jgi:transposase
MGKEVNKLNPHGKRQRYDKAFKLNAVALLKAGNKPATQLALELGIRSEINWVRLTAVPQFPA